MLESSCSNCAYLRHGRCHRYPPTVLALPRPGDQYVGPLVSTISQWPVVKPGDICGEHVPVIIPPPAWHSIEVNTQAFSTRARKALLALGINTLGKLMQRKKELWTAHNVGLGTIDHVEEVFNRLTGEYLNLRNP